jgi:hypothetical protein
VLVEGIETYKNGLATFSLHNIIYTYCGPGREKEAKDYLLYVTHRTGLDENHIVDLSKNVPLLSIARAFFRYEAGEESPVLDTQIEYGFNFARHLAPTVVANINMVAAHMFDPDKLGPI